MTRAERIMLKTGAVLVMGSGLLVGFGAWAPGGEPLRFFLDLLTWPLDGTALPGDAAGLLPYVIGGGVMLGWGWCLWMLATRGMEEAPGLSRRLILGSIGLWFLADSLGSLLAGAPLNVAGNLIFLGLFAWPLRTGT